VVDEGKWGGSGYSWDGNTLPDEIIADFAHETHHYNVQCPIVVLQFLTAPPMAA